MILRAQNIYPNMKKVLSIISLSAILFTSCMTSRALMGTYQDTAYTKTVDLTYEEAWSRVFDFFATTGAPITTIDKSSGLIVSGMSFRGYHTVERDGRPENPNAFVVTPVLHGAYGIPVEPSKITGDWNVRIKPQGDKTNISINVTNLECLYYNGTTNVNAPVASTGNFERSLFLTITQ